MLCDDPLVSALRSYGYNVVRLPSAQLTPLLLLESDRKRRTHVIGPIGRELPTLSAADVPTLHQDDPAPDLAITSTRRLRGSVAAEILSPLLTALGVDVGVSAELSRSRAVTIVLRSVRRDWIETGELARYLESGIGAGSRHVDEAAQRGQLFVITAILKTTTLVTGVERTVASKMAARGPGLPAASVRLGVEQSGQNDDQVVVTFEGPRPLAFAFQAVKLVYEDGVYTDFATAQGLVGYATPRAGAGVSEGMLLVDDDLVELDPS